MGIVFTHGVRMGGSAGNEKKLDTSETLRRKMLILGGDIGWE